MSFQSHDFRDGGWRLPTVFIALKAVFSQTKNVREYPIMRELLFIIVSPIMEVKSKN